MKIVFLFLCFLASCSTLPPHRKNLSQYQYTDSFGSYFYQNTQWGEEQKKIISQQILKESKGASKILEKKIQISTKEGRKITPQMSFFSGWFNKKAYKTLSKIKKDRINFVVHTPQKKYEESLDLPKNPLGKMCFFSQLYQCLKENHFFKNKKNSSEKVVILWDQYPFLEMLYDGVKNKIYSLGEIKFNKIIKKEIYRFNVEVENQIMFIDLIKKKENFKMHAFYWIAQGIAVESQEDV